jgi:hypothetical protein
MSSLVMVVAGLCCGQFYLAAGIRQDPACGRFWHLGDCDRVTGQPEITLVQSGSRTSPQISSNPVSGQLQTVRELIGSVNTSASIILIRNVRADDSSSMRTRRINSPYTGVISAPCLKLKMRFRLSDSGMLLIPKMLFPPHASRSLAEFLPRWPAAFAPMSMYLARALSVF